MVVWETGSDTTSWIHFNGTKRVDRPILRLQKSTGFRAHTHVVDWRLHRIGARSTCMVAVVVQAPISFIISIIPTRIFLAHPYNYNLKATCTRVFSPIRSVLASTRNTSTKYPILVAFESKPAFWYTNGFAQIYSKTLLDYSVIFRNSFQKGISIVAKKEIDFRIRATCTAKIITFSLKVVSVGICLGFNETTHFSLALA